MGFDTVKAAISTRLLGLAYRESSQAVDFKNAPVSEYSNTFILKCMSGEMNEDKSETLFDRFYDIQEWQVEVAFERSANNDIGNLDELHRKKDLILADLDDPASWRGSVRLLKYKSWEVLEFPSYYVLVIRLKVEDTYTY